MSGCASTLPATPLCAPPLTTTTRAGSGVIVSRDVPATPWGVVAVIVALPRRPATLTVAVALPVEVTVASDASLVSQRTSRSVMGRPDESTALAVNARVAAPDTVASSGVTLTVRVPRPGPVYWIITGGGVSGGRCSARATTTCVPENSTTPWSFRNSISAVKD